MKTKANNKIKILLAAFSLISLGFYFSSNLAFAKNLFGNENKQSNRFDFYVLSLSWTPSFCSLHNDEALNQSQCSNPRKTFVVHGLWPQYEHGYPRSCPSSQMGPSANIVTNMQDLMPSRRLVQIEWERHGTCSGLNAAQYFANIRNARARVQVPDFSNLPRQNLNAQEIERAFININRGLGHNGIAVISDHNLLSEVRICMTKELQFRDCDEVNARAARPLGQIRIPH